MNPSTATTFILLAVFAVSNIPAHCSELQSDNEDVRGLVAFKQAIFEDPSSFLASWNAMDANPCNWSAIRCSATFAVISINLSGKSLKGFVVPEIGLLRSLQQLYLNNNMFLGTIPKEIGKLKDLTELDLSENRLAGSIPSELGNLAKIKRIDLHSNGLTGSVPPELGKLGNLEELRLDRNRLKGYLPGSNNLSFPMSTQDKAKSGRSKIGLCQSPQLKVGDFSYNFFVGNILQCLKYLPRSSFQGNCFEDSYAVLQRNSQLCGPIRSEMRAKSTYKQANGGGKPQILQQPKWLLILEITTAVLVVICIITGTVAAVRNYKLKPSVRMPWKRALRRKNQIAISLDGELLKNVPKFSRQELEIACEDFSNIIGSSSESVVYKGTLKDGPEIAVISLCISRDHWTSYLEFSFQTKVADLSRLSHENIAKLIGYCKESEPFSRMLVLDYASNGTLYEHLHYGEGSQLSWLRRMKIVLGIARGLKYLHIDLQPAFALSQLNSNSVYITEDFSPKLVDFESWKTIFPRSEKSVGYMANGGSFHGYVDLEEQQEMDVQGNIYSFGVLLLEIISGRTPYCKDRGSLVDWATHYLQNSDEIGKLVDPELKNVRQEELAVICSVVSLCIEPDPSKRPSMQIIGAVLENGIDLSAASILKDSPLAWAELALSS